MYAQTRKRNQFRIWRNARPLLGQLDIELTERCNNACIHCCINLPEDDVAARSREMGKDFIKDILTQAADLGCLTVRFTGGEPLLREDLAELYVFTRRLGMQVILFTNGRLITPELAALLARMPLGRVVEVSVYGMRPESYDRAAGKKGAFSEFRRGVALLEKHQIPFIVKAPLLPLLKDDLEEFEAWAQTIPRMDKKPRYAMNFDLRSRRDDPAKNVRIAKLRTSPEGTVTMLSRNPLHLKDMRRFCGKFMGPPGDKLFSCGAGHGTCIDAYGKAQMCMGLRDPGTVYDLRDGADRHCEPSEAIPGTHAEIASSQGPLLAMTGLRFALAEYFPRFRELRSTSTEYLQRCGRCFLKGLCEQCPAKSWMEHGTLDTPVEYLCAVAHAQARYLGLITDQENAWEVERWRERVERFVKVHGSTVEG
jgi:sulfatase maturation enzyme AslB (radical SAM superfamily)